MKFKLFLLLVLMSTRTILADSFINQVIEKAPNPVKLNVTPGLTMLYFFPIWAGTGYGISTPISEFAYLGIQSGYYAAKFYASTSPEDAIYTKSIPLLLTSTLYLTNSSSVIRPFFLASIGANYITSSGQITLGKLISISVPANGFYFDASLKPGIELNLSKTLALQVGVKGGMIAGALKGESFTATGAVFAVTPELGLSVSL